MIAPKRTAEETQGGSGWRKIPQTPHGWEIFRPSQWKSSVVEKSKIRRQEAKKGCRMLVFQCFQASVKRKAQCGVMQVFRQMFFLNLLLLTHLLPKPRNTETPKHRFLLPFKIQNSKFKILPLHLSAFLRSEERRVG